MIVAVSLFQFEDFLEYWTNLDDISYEERTHLFAEAIDNDEIIRKIKGMETQRKLAWVLNLQMTEEFLGESGW